MTAGPSSKRSHGTIYLMGRRPQPAPTLEALEGRVLYAFGVGAHDAPPPGAAAPIPPVVDNAGNSYVLGTAGQRMAITRYKPSGELDTAWAEHGTYTVGQFESYTATDVPRAMTIDKVKHLIYVAGSSNGQWAIARINIDATYVQAWHTHMLTGTATALWLDTSENDLRLGVAGTSAAGEIQVAVLYALDTGNAPHYHSGGTSDESFAGTGFATAPASIYGIPGNFSVTATPTSLVERDDLPGAREGEGENEWIVQGTVTYSPGHSGITLARSVEVDFHPDGTAVAQRTSGLHAARGHGPGHDVPPPEAPVPPVVNTSIPAVVDNAGNSYVLGTDGQRMAISRYTPTGQLDTGPGWTTTGAFVIGHFTSESNQDTPRAIAIDNVHHYLYVAGGSDDKWAIARVNLGTSSGPSQAWMRTYSTGTANALSIDTSEGGSRIGVAGTTSSGNIQVAVLHAWDQVPSWNGGSLDTTFGGGTGFATAPTSIYGIPRMFSVTATPTALVERDDLPGAREGEGENEWLVLGTVIATGPGRGITHSRTVVVDFHPDGTAEAQRTSGPGAAQLSVFGGTAVGSGEDDANPGHGRDRDIDAIGVSWIRENRFRLI